MRLRFGACGTVGIAVGLVLADVCFGAEKVSTGDTETDLVMVVIQKKLKWVETCSARVLTTLRVMDQELRMDSRAAFRPPDLMRLELSLPDGIQQVVVSDGPTLWTYNAEERIVVRINRGRVYRETGMEPDTDQPDPTRPFRGLRWKTIRYAGVDSADGGPLHVFEALPEPNPMQAQLPTIPHRVRIHVHPEDGLLRHVKVFDAGNAEIITHEFTGLVPNAELGEAHFEFVVPAGAHVIDMTDEAIELLKSAGAAVRDST